MKVTEGSDEEIITQDSFNTIHKNVIQVIGQKPPVWMKRKKKKQEKKRKPIKQKNDIATTQCSQEKYNNVLKQENRFNKFISITNDFFMTVQNYLQDHNNKKLTKSDQKKRIKRVMHNLNKINNLILNCETLNEFKLYSDAINTVTYEEVLAPFFTIHTDIKGQDKYSLHSMLSRTIILKTFSMLFLPFFHRKCKNVFSLTYDNYRSKYMEILNKNNIENQYNQRSNHYDAIRNKFHDNKNFSNLCAMCFLNRILSRLAWSYFQAFVTRLVSVAKLSTDLTSSKTNDKIFIKNTSFYEMNFNNEQEPVINIHYERNCNDLIRHNEWKGTESLIDEQSGKYFINENLYSLIEDLSWIYYLKINDRTEILLIDSAIDEVFTAHLNSLVTGTDNTYSLIFEIDWLNNDKCYNCNQNTMIKCLNNANFIKNLHNAKKKMNGSINECNRSKSNHKSRNSRKSQFNNSLRKASGIYSARNNNELIRLHRRSDKRRHGVYIRKRIQSDGALNRTHKYFNENLSPNKKRQRRNISLPKDFVNGTTKIYSQNSEILHLIKNHRKQNSSFRKCSSDEYIFTRCERSIRPGDEPINKINRKCQTNSNKLKMISQNKTSLTFTEKEKASLNKHECNKNSCNVQ